MPATQGLGLGPYGTAFALAACIGIALALRVGRTRQFPRLAWMTVLGTALAAGIVGSKLVFLDFQPVEYGEKTILGGLIVGITSTLLVARAVGIGAWRALDAMAIPTLSAMAIGRVGCFLAGCCAGTPTEVPWAVAARNSDVHVHPAPLYEMAGDLLLITLLRRVPGVRADGDRFLIATVAYMGLRIAVESVRDGRTAIGPLNVVQWTLLVIAIPLVGVLVARRVRARKPVPALRPAVAVPAPQHTQGAVPLLVLAAILAALFVIAHAWFVPIERLALLSLVLACVVMWAAAVLPRRVWRLVPFAPLAFAPRAGALLVMQQDSSNAGSGARTELLIGGGYASGLYEQIVGHEPGDGCVDGPPTLAKRESRVVAGRAGIRRQTASGERLTLEGRYAAGADRLQRIQPGPVTAIPAPRNDIAAGGLAIMWEGRRAMWRADLLSGAVVREGHELNRVVATAEVNIPVSERSFVGAGIANSGFFPTTGEMTQFGIGFKTGRDQLRVYSTLVGEGYKAELSFPLFRTMVDLSYRTGRTSHDGEAQGSMFRVGVTQAVRLR
ncbi:prolipoprotein diacylglyceryl transferase [Pseudogemmatithrix spongiicola]|uniref:Prolipoprotein diacylglyceryl transferase n=1 Tax=Pseudogemmatithrix spongiicola TaxID=3062599 RepID=A0AA49JTN6_9BACT|nr:prolipoprotein diacylglyceryl transferase [Gemmatimonadaceae bacterium 'strain 138']WKW14644.1 prolipoprotein diacylglyceryl transferase [Gemmatimonadaceae bacterium 'strain 318']